MLNISGIGRTGPVTRKLSKPASGGGGFQLPDAERAAGLAETPETAASAPLSRADVPRPDQQVRDRAAREHGQETLRALADLQRDLTAQADNPEHLDRLVQLSAHVPDAATAGLRNVLRQVAVRAQVELARLEVARGAGLSASDA